jgi:hypothetical protein
MRKTWIVLGAALAAALVGWYFASPWWTLSQMRDAAKAGDAAAFSAHVDYEALRADVKADLAADLGAGDDGPGAALGRAFANAIAGAAVNALVSPEGLALAFAGRDAASAREAQVPGLKVEEEPVVNRTGLGSFRVEEKGKPGVGLVFERRGLGWKLVGLDLPKGGAR